MNKDIAIIGMAGVFPGAENINHFFKSLSAGIDSIEPISRQRMSATTIPEGDYPQLAMLDGVEFFDHEFFGISMAEAELMDPRQRVLLQIAYQCIENAGYSLDRLNGSKTSVFIGDTSLDYYKHAEVFDANLITGNMNAAIAGRISRFFNFRGTSEMIDTACSSSLVAVHRACLDLHQGESEYALVGGVRLILFPGERNSNEQLDIESFDGRCKTFSQDANGIGNGEVAVSILLKKYDKAINDNNHIYAIIKSTAVNQDAALSASLTAPNGAAQSEVIEQAWKKAGVNPESIGFIEAHGTGTKLGDPIEIDAINDAFRKFTNKRQFCAVGSVKTNIGHTDSAAGLTGLIKATLSIYYKVLFPSLHFSAPNPLIDFDNSAVYVNTKYKEWVKKDGSPRRAGVSAFSLIGTNCHCVLEEAPHIGNDLFNQDHSKQQHLILFSAKQPQSLIENILKFCNYLESEHHFTLSNLSHTLCARTHFKYRYAVIAQDINQLKDVLKEELASLQSQIVTTNNQRVVATFSDDFLIAPSQFDFFVKNFDAFRVAYNDCVTILKGSPNLISVERFIFQYSYFKWLSSIGFTSKEFIGEGIGKLVIRAISGEITLTDALRLVNLRVENSISLEDRIKKFLSKTFPNRERVLFVEMGPKGNLTRTLSSLVPEFDFIMTSSLNDSSTAPYEVMKNLYTAGVDLKWDHLLCNNEGQVIPLPSYQFEKKRCWIKPPTDLKSNLNDWLYTITWKEDSINTEYKEIQNKKILIFDDKSELADELVSILDKNNLVIVIRPGSNFEKYSNTHFKIDFSDRDQYILLNSMLTTYYPSLDGIIHLAPFDQSSSSIDNNIHLSDVWSKFYMISAFSECLNNKDFFFACLTSDAFSIPNNTSNARPAGAMAHALMKSVLAEYPMTKIHVIDVSSSEDARQVSFDILREISHNEFIMSSAYRQGRRYTQSLNLLPEMYAKPNSNDLQYSSTFIISGGATGVGFAIMDSIAQEGNTHFIILGRTDLGLQNEQTKLRINDLERIRLSGSTVDYIQVDITDEKAMKAIANELYTNIGNRNDISIIHAAGVESSWIPLDKQEKKNISDVIAPKVAGTINLEALAISLKAQRLILFSSLNSLVPQKFTSDYAMANAFQDAFAVNNSLVRIMSINWPGWRRTGMSIRNSNNREEDNDALRLLEPSDGVLVFKKCLRLSVDFKNIVVGQVNLDAFMVNPFFRIENKSTKAPPSKAIPQTTPANQTSKDKSVLARLKQIWKDVLKATQINDEDDFFNIGGHSLLGTQVINRIDTEFGLQIAFEDVFEYATPKEMANHIESMLCAGMLNTNSAISPIEEQDYYDVTPAQRSLWIMAQKHEARLTYSMPESYSLKGKLNERALEVALQRVVERHEILRTTFVSVNGEPKQRIKSVNDCGLKIDSIYIRKDSAAKKQLETIFEAEINTPFDLLKGPLFKAKLIHIDAEEFVILCNLHHIIVDAWSLEVIVKDIFTYYNALSQGQAFSLEPLRISYKDYTAWLTSQLRKEIYLNQKEYWLNEFSLQPESLKLPTDYPRPKVQTFGKGNFSFSIGNELKSALNELGKRNNATMFMILLAALKALLYRYTGQQDIVIGTPIAGRNFAQLEEQVGLYVNTLSIRSGITETINFKHLLANVKEKTMMAFENSLYPYDDMIFDLNTKSDLTRMPLFDVTLTMLNMQDATDETLALHELKVGRFMDNLTLAKFDLNFNFKEKADSLYVNVMYNGDLFTEVRVLNIAANFESLLTELVTNEEKPITEIDYISIEENSSIHSLERGLENKQTETEFLLHELFETSCLRLPDHIALVSADKHFSYKFLNDEAQRIAINLKSDYDLQCDERVAIALPKSDVALMIILAVLKAGAAYVPIDLTQPDDRVIQIIQDADPKLLITESYQLLRFAGHYKGAFLASDLQFDTLRRYQEVILPRVEPNSLAYIIYTSGSTGIPKGVMVEHAGIVNAVVWRRNQYKFDDSFVTLQIPALTFDSSIIDIFSTWLSGSKLVIPDSERWKDVLYLNDTIHKECVSTFIIVPTFYRELLEQCQINQPVSLRVITCAGERLTRALVTKHFSLFPNAILINEYGPTENSVCSTVAFVLNSNSKDEPVDIGKPIDNTQVFILDRQMNRLPIGVEGEICLGGPGLARGYLNNSELTNKKFVLYSGGKRIYKTGDLGKWNFSGKLEFTGRIGDQVKIRGNRVELGEIENALRENPNISDVVVRPVQKATGDVTLAAYLILLENYQVSMARANLRIKLPEYMVPELFIKMEHFPLNTSGKPDLKRFPDPFAYKTDASNLIIDEPESELETRLLVIWKQVLEKDDIGITDNFYDIGGHSLKGIQIVSRIRSVLQLKAELADIFSYPTIRKLAEVLHNGLAEKVPSACPTEEQEYYGISPMQYGMWVLSKYNDSSLSYSLPSAFELSGEISLKKLKDAFSCIIERHEILRTVFIEVNGIPQQKVLAFSTCSIKIEHLDMIKADHLQVNKTLKRLCTIPFEVSRFPLIEMTLITTSPSKNILFFNMHHMIADAWSMDIFINEFKMIYELLDSGDNYSPLDILQVQFKDYARAQDSNTFNDPSLDKLYWSNMLSHRTTGRFPIDYDRKRTIQTELISFTINSKDSKELNSIAKSLSTTSYAILLSCVNCLLHFYTKQEDVIIGIPVSCRALEEFDKQIGYYLNTLPIRTRFIDIKGFSEIVEAVTATLHSSFQHQHYPFHKIVSDIQDERDALFAPLFDVLVSWQQKVQVPKYLDGILIKEYPLPTVSSKFNMELFFSQNNEIIDCHFVFNSNRYKMDKMRLMMMHLERIIDVVVKNPDVLLTNLDPFINVASTSASNRMIPDMEF